jgi:chromosome segregation ATPase
MAMAKMARGLYVAIAVALCSVAGVAAAQDARADREREMLRRTQEALRESQAEASELSANKAATEQKLKTASDELEATRRTSKSTAAALHSQLQASTAAQEDLTRRLTAATQELAALKDQQRDTANKLSERDTQLKTAQGQLEQSRAANTSCEAKNVQLYDYSKALMVRYQKKGVWDAITQKEPVTGIREVGVENVLQDYQDKLDAQRVAPAPAATH